VRDAHEANRRLGRGINFGGVLDVGGDPAQRSWLSERHFDVVAHAGFATVRLPTMWSAHADTAPPYAIDRAFVSRCGSRLHRTTPIAARGHRSILVGVGDAGQPP
jgi:hypothetical protein